MILYKTIIKLYKKAAYSPGLSGLPLASHPSTRTREIALFMVMGAPFLLCILMIINSATAGGSKIVINIASNEIEGAETSSGISSSSSSFF
jgi:hypothetical protein